MDEGMDKWIKAVRKGQAEELPANEVTNRWLRAIHAQLDALRRWAVFLGILFVIGILLAVLSAILKYGSEQDDNVMSRREVFRSFSEEFSGLSPGPPPSLLPDL